MQDPEVSAGWGKGSFLHHVSRPLSREPLASPRDTAAGFPERGTRKTERHKPRGVLAITLRPFLIIHGPRRSALLGHECGRGSGAGTVTAGGRSMGATSGAPNPSPSPAPSILMAEGGWQVPPHSTDIELNPGRALCLAWRPQRPRQPLLGTVTSKGKSKARW